MNNNNTVFKRISLSCLTALATLTSSRVAVAQTSNPQVIASIKVHKPDRVRPPVKGRDSINSYGGLFNLTDEHSTIIRRKLLDPNDSAEQPPDEKYLFFVASNTELNEATSGLVVLAGKPDSGGVWTLDFDPDYQVQPAPPNGGTVKGQIFISPFEKGACPPTGPLRDPYRFQDFTFDLNYANPGSVIIDPTRIPSEAVLMIYEGVTQCLNVDGGIGQLPVGDYASIGVATSLDHGKTWPTYRKNFTVLPQQSTTVGPDASASGAFGAALCAANDCKISPPAMYGRYPVSSVPYSTQQIFYTGQPANGHIGEQAPSAFVDDVHLGAPTYVYEVHFFSCPAANGACMTTAPNDRGIGVSRALLQGNNNLAFDKWYKGSFWPATGVGGRQSPLFPINANGFAACEDVTQIQTMPSISYVEATQQYLLVFLCNSPGNPADPSVMRPSQRGAAWFYSTLDATQFDLSNQDQWGTPVEIEDSWQWFQSFVDKTTNTTKYCIYDGNYPSLMSPHLDPGHLTTNGFVFSMEGCSGGADGQIRHYMSRVFEITLKVKPPACPKCPGPPM